MGMCDDMNDLPPPISVRLSHSLGTPPPSDETELVELEEKLVEETSTYIAKQLVKRLARSKLWRESRAATTLCGWIRSGRITYKLLSCFFRYLRHYHCYDTLRCVAAEAGSVYPFSSLHLHVCLPIISDGQLPGTVSKEELQTCESFVSAPRTHIQWIRLARYNPTATLELLKKFRAVAESPRRDIDIDKLPHLPSVTTANAVFNILLDTARTLKASHWIKEIIQEVKLYLQMSDAYEKWDYSRMIKACPAECVAWGRHLPVPCGTPPSSGCSPAYRWNYYGQVCGPLTLPGNFTAQISSKKFRKLSRDLIMEISRENLSFQKYLPTSYRQLLWDELREKKRAASTENILPPDFLTHFPIHIREEEALKALETSSVQLNDDLRFNYIRLLSLEKAMPLLWRQFRNPDFEIRQKVYEIFGFLTKSQKADATPFLDLCEKCVNDRDPLRGYLYDALSVLDFHKLNDNQLDKIQSFLTITANQIDMSYETADYVESVLNKFFRRRPRECLKLQQKFSTHEQLSNYLPALRCEKVSEEALRVLDEWVATRKPTIRANLVSRIMDLCTIKQIAYLPNTCRLYIARARFHYHTHPSKHAIIKILTYYKKADKERYVEYIRQVLELDTKAISNREICQWALKEWPEKVDEYFTKNIRSEWQQYFSTFYLLKLPSIHQSHFAQYICDEFKAQLTENGPYKNPYNACIILLIQMRQMIYLHPWVYLNLIDCCKSVYEANRIGLSEDNTLSSLCALLVAALSRLDDPWITATTILERIRSDPHNPCRLALPKLLMLLSPQRQSQILVKYQTLPRRSPLLTPIFEQEKSPDMEDDDQLDDAQEKSAPKKVTWYHILEVPLAALDVVDEYLVLLSHCSYSLSEVQAVVAPLLIQCENVTDQQIRLLKSFCCGDARFWDNLVFKRLSTLPADDDLSLLRRILRIHPLYVRLAGRTAAVQEWLQRLACSEVLSYKLLTSMYKLLKDYNGTFLSSAWFYDQIPRFYTELRTLHTKETELLEIASAIIAHEKEDETSLSMKECKLIHAQQRPSRIEAVKGQLLDTMCPMTRLKNDPNVCIRIVELSKESDIDDLLQRYKEAHWSVDLNDQIFLAWFTHLRSSVKDSLGAQVKVLGAIKSTDALIDIFRTKLYDLSTGVLLLPTSFACDTIELAKQLSNDSNPSHRYLAYKLLSAGNVRTNISAREALTQLETSFQYDFVEAIH